MSWTLEYRGKMYAVPDGQSYTITEQRRAAAGGFEIVRIIFREDGSNYVASSQHYPEHSGYWVAEEETPSPYNLRNEDLGATPLDAYKNTRIEDFGKTPPEIYKKLMQMQNEEPLKIMQMENKEPDQMPKERLHTGQRLHFRHPQDGSWVSGTIIDPDLDRKNRMRALPEGRVLVCADEQDMKNFRDAPELTGEGYGVIVSRSKIALFSKNFSTDAYDTVPDHIGIVTVQEFFHDDVTFNRYSTGRLVQINAGGTALISWYKKKNGRFANTLVKRSNGKVVAWENCYNVPTEYLNWCRLSSSTSVEVVWPGRFLPQAPKFNVRDYIVYTAERSLKVGGPDGHYFAIAKGAILQITGQDSQGVHYLVRTVSSCRKGLETQLTSDAFVLLKASYLPGGTPVEVTAHLEFKKRDLQGQKGVIVLPTDADGDVGVEFNEDIGAGSLDGHGKSRHCLYVPADSVQTLTK